MVGTLPHALRGTMTEETGIYNFDFIDHCIVGQYLEHFWQ
jgi:hypothetical protein